MYKYHANAPCNTGHSYGTNKLSWKASFALQANNDHSALPKMSDCIHMYEYYYSNNIHLTFSKEQVTQNIAVSTNALEISNGKRVFTIKKTETFLLQYTIGEYLLF